MNSPPLTFDSPALRLGDGKSGVGGVEWEVSSTQNVVVLTRQEADESVTIVEDEENIVNV